MSETNCDWAFWAAALPAAACSFFDAPAFRAAATACAAACCWATLAWARRLLSWRETSLVASSRNVPGP